MTVRTDSEELWHVQLGTGEIRCMSLDDIQRCFDEGTIDVDTPVFVPGVRAWTTLGGAAGLHPAPATLGAAAGLQPAPVNEMPSLSPVAIGSPSGSTKAVDTSDGALEDWTNEWMNRRRARRRIVVTMGAVAVAALAAMLVVGRSARTLQPDTMVNALTPPAAEEIPPPREETRMGTNVNSAEGAASVTGEGVANDHPSAAARPRLSEWQKKLLIDADRAREQNKRERSRRTSETTGKPKPSPKKSNSGLLNGGHRFDPLNGSL